MASSGDNREIRVGFVEGYGPVCKTVLKNGEVIVMEGPEAEGRIKEVLEAVRSG